MNGIITSHIPLCAAQNCRGSLLRSEPLLIPDFSSTDSKTHPKMSADPPPGDALDLPPPALRDILRVCLTAKEYRFLHATAKPVPALQNKLTDPSRYDVIARPRNRHSEAAVRASLRVLVGSGIALKLGGLLIGRFTHAPQYDPTITKGPYLDSLYSFNSSTGRRSVLRFFVRRSSVFRSPYPSSYSFIVSYTASSFDCAPTCARTMRSRLENETRAFRVP